MATKRFVWVGAVFVALLGCTTLAPPAARVNCGNSGSCDVSVHVKDCVITAPDVDVFVATNIFWNIDQASLQDGYKYPPDPPPGIWIKDGNPGQFESPQRLSDGKFKLHDKNTAPGTSRYGVRVVRGSTTCPDLDPSIVNH
jgi:hypothetical protein